MVCLKKYHFILALTIFSLWGCRLRPLLPSLKETYSYDDKNPFGGYVAFQKILDEFDNVKIVYGNDQTIESDKDIYRQAGKHSLYFIISDKLFLSQTETEWALEYVASGNELFLSANQFGAELLRRLGVKTNQSFARLNDRWGNMCDTRVNIFFGDDLPQVPFGFYYYPFENYFRNFNEKSARILGVNDLGEPDFIILFIGKGKLFLHLAPRALSNYFLLTENNINYFNYVLNYLDHSPAAVYWDEYYNQSKSSGMPDKSKKEGDFSSLDVINEHAMLKWAFFIAMTGLLLFIFSEFKRKQRLIPVQPKPLNATVDFVETVGRLYFINKDNKNIAAKLTTYFYENVRSKYFLVHTTDMESFALRLAGKKGMPEHKITELLNCITEIENSMEISDAQLLNLNQLLEQFYKHK